MHPQVGGEDDFPAGGQSPGLKSRGLAEPSFWWLDELQSGEHGNPLCVQW